MDYIDILWSFFEENKEYFSKMSQQYSVKIDFEKRIFFIGRKWYADPFYLLLKLFRDKFNDLGPSGDSEFNRINKILYSAGIKIPISKREYDTLIDAEIKNQTALAAIEESLGVEDGKFIIPSKEYAERMFKNSAMSMDRVLGGLFVYAGRTARVYIDLYDRFAGIEVFLDSGTIFVSSLMDGVERPAFNESNARNIPVGSIITIDSILSQYTPDDGCVMVPPDYTDSVKNICQYFSTFQIRSGVSSSFIIDVSLSILKFSEDPIIMVEEEDIVSFLSSLSINEYLNNGASSIPILIDIAKVISRMPQVKKTMFVEMVSPDLGENIIRLITPYIEGGEDDRIIRLIDITTRENIELCARVSGGSSDFNQIRFYNNRTRQFGDFSVDKNGISNILIPELGGLRYLASECGISGDNIPSGYSNVDMFLTVSLLKIVQGELGRLPLFDRFVGDGIHAVGDRVVLSTKHNAYGSDNHRAIGGTLIKSGDIDVALPSTRVSKNQAAKAIANVVSYVERYIPSSKQRDLLFGVLLCSTIFYPLVKRGNKITLNLYGGGQYAIDGVLKKIFRDIFRYSKFISTDTASLISAAVDNTTTPIVLRPNKDTAGVISELIKERAGSETIKKGRGGVFHKYSNTAPLILVSDSHLIVEESIVFNFPFRTTVEAGAYLSDDRDISASLCSFAISSHKAIPDIEHALVKRAIKMISKDQAVYKNPHVDFFEKILPAMCMLQLTEFMDPWEFYSLMHDMYFDDENIRLNVNLHNVILSLAEGAHKVEDKIYDSSLRLNQTGDLTFVDNFINTTRIGRDEDSGVFLIIFNRSTMFRAIKHDLGITFSEFNMMLENSRYFISAGNAMKNYRLQDDNTKTPVAIFKDVFEGKVSEFAAIRVFVGKYDHIRKV